MNALRPKVLALAVSVAFAGAAHGQIVTDGRLGPAGPVTPSGGNYAITNTLGTQVGGNLFHSFTTFNLATGNVATFSGTAGTANIVARVTGGSGSSIDGTMRSTIAGANLWFINPWGVTFGANAQLDVSGAFHASTASHLALGSGPGSGRFDAVNPSASKLVSAAPSAFGFLGAPAPLTVNGSTLAGAEGKELSLVGGKLTLNGATLRAYGGRINLASAGGAGEIGLGASVTPSLGMAMGEVRIAGGLVSTESPAASAMDSGPIYIRSGKLTLENARIHTRIDDGNSSTGNGGRIDIAATGDMLVSNSDIDSGVFNPSSSASGGNIFMAAGGQMTIADGSRVRSVLVTGSGASGSITISAGTLTVDGSFVSTSTGGDTAAGPITVNVGDLYLRNGGSIRASSLYDGTYTPPNGLGGDIVVNATGLVDISGNGSGLFSKTEGYGDAGSIRVSARDIALRSGGMISTESTDPLVLTDTLANTVRAGDAGSITLDATGSITLHEATISSAARFTGGGSITIRAVDTLALDHSSITTSVHGRFTSSNAGSISIDPVFVILSGGSQILTTAVVGSGGPVSISTQFFMMSPDSLIDTSSTFGQAGTLTINSPNTDTVSELGALPGGYFDASALLRESCAARAGRGANSFVGVGRGGLPAGPGALAFASYAIPAATAAAAPLPLPQSLLLASLPSACVR